MSLLIKLERKFGRYAFPMLIQTIAVFWVLTYFLIKVNPDTFALFTLDIGKVLSGQVWRIISFILITPTFSPLYLFFAVYFTFFLGGILEREWGAFRVNVFMFSGILLTVLFGFVLYFCNFPSASLNSLIAICERTFSMSILLSCACICPELEIRLMGIIPVKMKWLGVIDAGLIALTMISGVFYALAAVVALIPFFVIYLPIFITYSKQRANAAARLHKFKEASKLEGDTLHHCAVCHKTEVDSPELHFRVSGGEEYCVPCLEEKKKAAL
jgi:hypothetical protein